MELSQEKGIGIGKVPVGTSPVRYKERKGEHGL